MQSLSSRWRTVGPEIFPWATTIQRILRAEPLPELAGQTINIFSDYGGNHKASQYAVIGVLYMDIYASARWEVRRRAIRKHYLPDGRRMSFKALGDRSRQLALVPFLRATEDIEGLCLVLAIRKSIGSLCVNPGIADAFAKRVNSRQRRPKSVLERMMRVTHIVALLIGGLSKPDQNIYWISDEDELFANEAASLDLRDLLGRFSTAYTPHALGELGLGTTSIDEGDRFEEDHVAVADLAVGAVAEMLSGLCSVAGGHLPVGVAVPFREEFTPKTALINSWFLRSTASFRKVCIVIERPAPSQLAVFRFNMSHDSAAG